MTNKAPHYGFTCPTCKKETAVLAIISQDDEPEEFYCEECCETFQRHELILGAWVEEDANVKMQEESVDNLAHEIRMGDIVSPKKDKDDEVLDAVDKLFSEIMAIA